MSSNVKRRAMTAAGGYRHENLGARTNLGDLLKERLGNNNFNRLAQSNDLRKQAARRDGTPVNQREKPDLFTAVEAGAVLGNDGSLDVVATAIKAVHRGGAQDMAKALWPQLWPQPLKPGDAGATTRPIRPPRLAEDNPNSFRATGGSRPPIEATHPSLPVLDAGVASQFEGNEGRLTSALDEIKRILAAGPKPFPRKP
jgi:hypothetical protein